jgi:hypothetical protein
VIGSWDRCLYAWRIDGSLVEGWPQKTGHFVWSTARAVELDDQQLAIIAASDQVYLWRGDGSLVKGWPQPLNSYAAGSALVADLDGDGQPEIILGADRLYGWKVDGMPLTGFPVDAGSYLWSSPAAGDVDGDGELEIVVGGWDGRIYVLRSSGDLIGSYQTNAPIFASPLVADIDQDGRDEVIIGSWDAHLYVLGIEDFTLSDRSPSIPVIYEAGKFSDVREHVPVFVSFPDLPASQGTMFYHAAFETNWHPVPLVQHRGRLTGLIQPFPKGTQVDYYAEVLVGTQRSPSEGNYQYETQADWLGRVQRRANRWLVKRQRGTQVRTQA